MIVYIHKRAGFFTPEQELTRPQFGIGYTLGDYYNGKFVRLNQDQINYWMLHEGCTPAEAFNMRSRLVPPAPEPEPEPIVSGSVSGSIE